MDAILFEDARKQVIRDTRAARLSLRILWKQLGKPMICSDRQLRWVWEYMAEAEGYALDMQTERDWNSASKAQYELVSMCVKLARQNMSEFAERYLINVLSGKVVGHAS